MEPSLPADSETTQLTSISESSETAPHLSPFLAPGAVSKANQLAIVQLAKDDFVPVYLSDTQGEHDGYKEGHVLNTRFGSFPHSTLIGIPWGSQVRASVVDTGTRGRVKKTAPKPKNDGEDTHDGLKRKREVKDEGEKRVKSSATNGAAVPGQDNTATEQAPADEAIPSRDDVEAKTEDVKITLEAPTATKQAKPKNPPAAHSGFVHILAPTPEIWTTSLPHRTQVVYTPDYSYILQRIRARPGTRIIEAGSGSGSFTHASARAVFDGALHSNADSKQPTGKVFSFEFHEQRFRKIQREVEEHRLKGLVETNHRDVYNNGFLVDGKSPEADAVFLDLPAPWLALPHLSRRKPQTGAGMEGVEGAMAEEAWVSPLNPKRSVYLCTFSPCIEQVIRTVSEMRRLGWVDIDMVEIAHKRINVFREKLGLDLVSDRGQQLAPKNVAEAVAKLREVELKSAEHNAKMLAQHMKKKPADGENDEMDQDTPQTAPPKINSMGDRQVIVEESKEAGLKPFMQGQLVTRPEAELKAHTSYLVFAILPREWTEEDEAAAAAKWPIGKEPRVLPPMDRASRKQQKREMLQSKGKKNKKETRKHESHKIADPKSEEVKGGDAVTAEDVNMEEVLKTE